MKAALDTNTVILLGQQDPKTTALISHLLRLDFELIIPPTVQAELNALETRGTPEEKKKATLAIQAIITHNLTVPAIRPMHERFIEQIALKFMRDGVIKKQEKNDASILVETAFLRCPILFTTDNHIKMADQNLGENLLREYKLRFPKPKEPRNHTISIF